MGAVLWAVGGFRQHRLTVVLPSAAAVLFPSKLSLLLSHRVHLFLPRSRTTVVKSPLMFVPFTASSSQVGGSVALERMVRFLSEI